MDIEVRYQSRGGNTKAVAEIIAKTIGVVAKSIDEPLPKYTDILFIGGGVYKWDADDMLIEYLKHLDRERVGAVVAFSTTGAMAVTIKRIKEYTKKAGIKVFDKSLCLKVMLQGHSALGREGGHLKDQQIKEVENFAKSILSEC